MEANRNNDSLCLPHHGIQNFLIINDTLFHKNSAKMTGGAMYIIYKDNDTDAGIKRKLTITKCYFTENVADGAAMESGN